MISNNFFRKLSSLFLVTAVTALLSSCGGLSFPGVYRINIPQGNLISQDKVDQLRPGLSKRQVTFILGTPLVRDTFTQDRWDYLYSIQQGGGERLQERITVYFEDGELVRFDGDFTQTPEKEQFGQSASSEETADSSTTSPVVNGVATAQAESGQDRP